MSEAPWDGSCPAGSSDPGKNGAQSERLTGSGPFLWRPARRPSAVSGIRRSAILAPRCQAAGGGESLVISSLRDFGGFIHGTLNTRYSILKTIIGGYWWHDWKVDIDLVILPRQSHVRRFYSTKLRRQRLRIAALALTKSDWDQVPHTFHEVILDVEHP